MGNNHSNDHGGKAGSNGDGGVSLQFTSSSTTPTNGTGGGVGSGSGHMTTEQKLIAADRGMTRTASGANLQEQRFGNQLQPIEKLAKVKSYKGM